MSLAPITEEYVSDAKKNLVNENIGSIILSRRKTVSIGITTCTN